ncbi:MAG: hypothetical protein R2764_15350, partial [Bacteroidales bacterium]
VNLTKLANRLSRNGFLYLSIFGLVFLSGCQSNSAPNENAAWEKAQEENTIEAYDNFVSKFPEGEFTSKANTEITRILFDEAKTGNSIEMFDKYVARFPQGKNKSAFEPYVYEYISKQDSTELFEEYVKRFPEGKYLSEFELSIFDGIKKGTSTLTYSEFVSRFPNSEYLSSIDSLMYFTSIKSRNTDSYDEYISLFPAGIFRTAMDTTFISVFYKTAVNENNSDAFNAFLNRFPRSKYVKTLMLETNPGGQEVTIKDANDSTWKKVKTPGSLKVIEGTNLILSINNPDFKPELLTHIVSDKPEQKINIELRGHSKSIVSELFTKSSSTWAFSTNENKSEILNNTLKCSVKSSQFQNIQKVIMDLNSNFEIEIKFRITDAIVSYRRPYVGVLWGEETKVKFYFITNDGRYNYGIQGSALGTDNPYGYSNWDGYSVTSDSWIKTDNYVENGFNSLKVVKKDSQIKYFINDKYVHFENDMTRFRNSWVGFGIGNANVLIDYFRVEQYTD